MNENNFIKQNHKNIKVAFMLMYSFILVVTIFCMYTYKGYYIACTIFLIAILILFHYLIKLFNSFGIHMKDGKVYYKTLKMKEVDINKIVGIKIIKSEAQVNLAWSSFDMKNKEGKNLYSMIFLSKIENDMKEYPYGDLEFVRTYKKSIIMYSVYDKRLIDYFKEHTSSLEILDYSI